MTGLFEEYQGFRQILCICPCCEDIVRVSDLHIGVKGQSQKTWLDKIERANLLLDAKEEKFEEKEGKIRALAVERGRIEAEKTINKAVYPGLQALKLDPFDIKPILTPIDFIAFNGMTKNDTITEIMLISKTTNNQKLNALREQTQKAITKKEYEWKVARINEECKICLE
jgi:predicted Holliday junction resolvase-like endonuclease